MSDDKIKCCTEYKFLSEIKMWQYILVIKTLLDPPVNHIYLCKLSVPSLCIDYKKFHSKMCASMRKDSANTDEIPIIATSRPSPQCIECKTSNVVFLLE